MKNMTVFSALDTWLETVKRSKSRNTWRTYNYAASVFRKSMGRNIPLEQLTATHYEAFLVYLKSMEPATEKLIATIMALFFQFLSAKELRKINTDSIRYMRSNETRKVGRRIRKMDMPSVAEIAEKIVALKTGDDVILARAKAFVLTLCRTGLRAFEAGGLKTLALDGKKMRGVIIGKGNKEAYFIIDADMLVAIRKYHQLRKEKADYIFISHSKRDSKKTPRHIETDTARRDVILICNLLLEHEPEYKITPHQFRHYFVTQIWRESGDLKLAQDLARHDNIATTQGYVHTDDSDMTEAAEKLSKSRRRKA